MNKDLDDDDRLYRLLAAVSLGDRQAFRLLYDTTAPRLFGFALRILKKDELAQEAVQDAFVAVWHAASTYQAHLSAPLTWMTTIVRNKALDLYRRAQANGDFEHAPAGADAVDALADTEAGPMQQLALSREAQALAACMETLAGRQRQAIGMAYLHELSHSEVAARLSLPIGTVKTWIRRGLERLRDCLDKREKT